MGWFGRKPMAKPDRPTTPPRQPGEARAKPAVSRAVRTVGSLDGGLVCVACGRPLGFDPEDEPNGDGAGRHLCGECNRQRNFDADLEMMWFNGDL